MKKETAKKATPKKAEPIELTKAVLLAAAKDINKADIADPPIDIKGSESQLKKALLAASEIVEPEDELKPETFAVLKAVAEEDPEDADEDNEEDADEDEGKEVEDDETEAEESSLEDLTVAELQAKCKEAGIAFTPKKTTKAQLIAALEAHEAEQDEIEDDKEEDVPEPEVKPEKKAVPVKAQKKATVKKDSGPGVIASILEFIQEAKAGISVTQIAEKLAKRFPDKQADSMFKTVKAQIGGKKSPTRMEKEKGVKFAIKDGLYSVK